MVSFIEEIGNSWLGGTTDVSQVPLETPEQAAARKALLDFSKTGKYGNYSAGDAYGGSLGNFGMSALEQAGQSQVAGRLGGGFNDPNMMLSDQVLQDLLGTDKYNPLQPGGVYDSVSGGIDRATNQAQAGLKRGAAFGGSLYSTNTIQGLGDVQAQGVNTKAQTMAGLFQNYMNQKLGAIPQGYAAAGQKEDMGRARTADAYQYGALPRNLENQEAQAKYAEFQRQRQEQQGQISALSSVAGQNANFGVPTVSVPKDNPWMDVLGLLAQFGGQYVGSRAGAKTVPKAA